MTHEFRAYCDICKGGSNWLNDYTAAKGWRLSHFNDEHPDNPMRKENCRIQRKTL